MLFENDLCKYMNLEPGSVTPLGLLNDTACHIFFYLDQEFNNQLIGIHPNDNTATIWLHTSELVKLVQETNHQIEFVEI